MRFSTFLVLFIFYVQTLSAQDSLCQSGIASFYAEKFEGRKTANGEQFSNSSFTAAHRKLPFHTLVRVTNPDNERSVIVRINDRGPFVKGRIIDLSRAAAHKIRLNLKGHTLVHIEPVYETVLTEELNQAFRSNHFSDCLGNADSLYRYTLLLFRTENLQHLLYLSNDLQDFLEKEKVIIEYRKPAFFLLLTGIPNKTACEGLIEDLKQDGYFKSSIYKSPR